MKNLTMFVTACMAMVACVLLCATPASALPYKMLDWNEYPAKDTVSGGKWEQELFPDLAAGVVTYSEFGEEQLVGGQRIGILTVICSRQSYLSLIYYSPAGKSFVAHPGLLVTEYHQVSVSMLLPGAQDDGLTLLLIWDKAPDRSWLDLLAQHPNRTVEPIPGVISEGWFQRSPRETGRHPWESSFDNTYRNAPLGFSSTLPQIYAGIDSFGTWCTKDCSVENTGTIQQLFNMSGSSNVLELTATDTLELRFFLNTDTSPGTAWLYLLAFTDPQSSQSGGLTVDIAINNWYISGPVLKQDDFQEMQPLGFDVSHFLQGGYNLVEVSLSPFSDSSVFLDNIELWVN